MVEHVNRGEAWDENEMNAGRRHRAQAQRAGYRNDKRRNERIEIFSLDLLFLFVILIFLSDFS